jgi:hypothetical protein
MITSAYGPLWSVAQFGSASRSVRFKAASSSLTPLVKISSIHRPVRCVGVLNPWNVLIDSPPHPGPLSVVPPAYDYDCPPIRLAGTGEPKSRELTGRPFQAFLVASDTSIEAALEPVKVFEGIPQGVRDVGSRFAVQPLGLD